MIDGLITILKTNATVQTVIGKNKEDDKYKVYPGVCPRPEAFPFIVVRRTSKPPVGRCKGTPSTTFQPSIDVIIYHKSYNKLEEIESAVIDALDWTSGIYEGINYKTIQFQTSYDADYIKEYELHARVVEFEAIVNAGAVT